jgi:predicted Zn-dependent peptidase
MHQISGSVENPKAGESLIAMRAGVQALRDSADFDIEFVRARRTIVNRLLGESTESYTLAGRLSQIAKYGLGPDHYDKFLRMVAAASPAQVKALIATELDPSQEVIVCMGGREVLEKAFAEAGFADVKYVEPSDN